MYRQGRRGATAGGGISIPSVLVGSRVALEPAGAGWSTRPVYGPTLAPDRAQRKGVRCRVTLLTIRERCGRGHCASLAASAVERSKDCKRVIFLRSSRRTAFSCTCCTVHDVRAFYAFPEVVYIKYALYCLVSVTESIEVLACYLLQCCHPLL